MLENRKGTKNVCGTDETKLFDKYRSLARWYVRQMKLFNFMIVGQVRRQTSCMDLFLRHQKRTNHGCVRHTERDIKGFAKMADEFRTKNIA